MWKSHVGDADTLGVLFSSTPSSVAPLLRQITLTQCCCEVCVLMCVHFAYRPIHVCKWIHVQNTNVIFKPSNSLFVSCLKGSALQSVNGGQHTSGDIITRDVGEAQCYTELFLPQRHTTTWYLHLSRAHRLLCSDYGENQIYGWRQVRALSGQEPSWFSFLHPQITALCQKPCQRTGRCDSIVSFQPFYHECWATLK